MAADLWWPHATSAPSRNGIAFVPPGGNHITFSSKQPSRDQLLHIVQLQRRILLQKVGARLLL